MSSNPEAEDRSTEGPFGPTHEDGIPLADEDPSSHVLEGESEDMSSQITSSIVSSTESPSVGPSDLIFSPSSSGAMVSPDGTLEDDFSTLASAELSVDDQEEKARLIAQVLELQNTLDDLSHRVDSVKLENFKLRSENQVLAQYMENLMAGSSVFQPTAASSNNKGKKSRK